MNRVPQQWDQYYDPLIRLTPAGGGMPVPINIRNEPCQCPKGECMHFCSNDEACINRLSGDVRTLECSKCGSFTWHQNGACLRCRTIEKEHA